MNGPDFAHPELLPFRCQLARLLRHAADRFDERGLAALAGLNRRAAVELDAAERALARTAAAEKLNDDNDPVHDLVSARRAGASPLWTE